MYVYPNASPLEDQTHSCPRVWRLSAIMCAQLRTPHEHLGGMVPRGLRLAFAPIVPGGFASLAASPSFAALDVGVPLLWLCPRPRRKNNQDAMYSCRRDGILSA